MWSHDVHIHDVKVDNGDVTAPPPSPARDPTSCAARSPGLRRADLSSAAAFRRTGNGQVGSSNVLAERLDCTHSHGITIGSVWYDDVSNVTCEPTISCQLEG